MPIRLLPPDVSSRIAAGEVIERPASVVKELVENSLDAKASEVSIEIREGGSEYIRVADNGVGIPADEVELAFERFATSKLREAADLEAISTLGFRGEALPSIAAVSTVSLVSRAASEEDGTRVDVVDGAVAHRRRQGAASGTVLTVRHLFRSFPARRKFMRSPATEASRVQALVTRYALAYPAVRFELSVNGSPAFSTSGSRDLREAISDVYGRDTGAAMLELARPEPQPDGPHSAVSGMIGPASLSRASRSHISIFVNGRWVQDRMLGYALEEAYRGFLAERRYPVAVVALTVPPGEVDVNVHPSKTEVRFHRGGVIFSALQQAVRHTLTTDSPVPEIGPSSASAYAAPLHPRGRPFWPGAPGAPTQLAGAAPVDHTPSGAHEGQTIAPAASPPLVPREALPALRVLGQVQATYIAAEGPDGVYLIDQHAAHERVLFEKAASQPAESQSLLEPATVDLDPRQSEMAASHRELIAGLGFQYEPFGGRTYILRGVPGLLSEGDPGQSFVDVLDLMAEGGGFESWEERAAYSIACHGAVRAGKTMSHDEMSELTRVLELSRQPHTCPHGRPTMIHLSSAALEREFGRR